MQSKYSFANVKYITHNVRRLNMKKIMSLMLLIVFVVSACAKTPQIYHDGTYEGVGEGKKGPVAVSVTFISDKITKVEVTAQEETPDIAQAVLDALPEQIVERQGTADVDVFTGSSYTRDVIIAAVEQAIENARIK